jgi:hypothetical protein
MLTAVILFLLLLGVSFYKYQESKQMINLGGMNFNSNQINNIVRDLYKEDINTFIICNMEEKRCTQLNIQSLEGG